MHVRKKRNKSGSISVQIIQKVGSKNKLIKTIGNSKEEAQIKILCEKAQQEIYRIKGQASLFVDEKDNYILAFIDNLQNSQIRTIGPELIFGSIYKHIGFEEVDDFLFKHIVVSRISYPMSKLKTMEYLQRYQGVSINVNSIYKFLDKLSGGLKDKVEKLCYANTLKHLGGKITIAFYDLTTLYFETSDEDDLRKAGFSKDGKHSNPQIYLGLLVGLEGYAIGYDIFEGSIYEGYTLIPTIKQISEKFNLSKPMIVADAGLLNGANIRALEVEKYEYIIGARLKNEKQALIESILQKDWKNNQVEEFAKGDLRLIVQYSDKRAKKDIHNREKGLNNLEKKIKSGKLRKEHINNRGYNKYLKIEGEVKIEIDYEKYNADEKWDGLKGYLTNCELGVEQIIENYKNLWHIEKAFRMSKTDLRIRPIYHRLEHRIRAHICISFVAYTIYKELERVLKLEKYPLSVEKSAELTHTIYQIEFYLPESLTQKKMLLKMDKNQEELVRIVKKYFWATQK